MTDSLSSQQSSLYDGLNPPQREAVAHVEGPILVLAGAGSGKTRVLTRRVVALVNEQRVSPEEILAVTFTNKAAEEMRSRLKSLLGQAAERLLVGTFHSISLRILRRYAPHLGYTSDFVVYDEQDSRSVLKAVLKQKNIDEKKYPPQLFAKVMDRAKNAYITSDKFKSSHFSKYEAQLQEEVYAAYQQALLRENAMDFGDLLVNSVRLLSKPEIGDLFRRRIKFILVDEYQDTNAVQYLFIRLLANPRNNLLVVGDDDQSIYAFRGATIRNILEFEKDYPSTKVVKLEQNYRSAGNILKAAHGVIEKNKSRKGKKLWTDAGDGEKLHTYVALDEAEEASFIAREIGKLVLNGGKFSDIAIFYRTNAQSRAIEEALLGEHIPYKIFGGLKFYERKEIKDILAYLRLLLNESDNQAFLRVINTPPRGIGAQAVQAVSERSQADSVSMLAAAASLISEVRSARAKSLEDFLTLIKNLRELAQKAPLSELIRTVIAQTGYLDRLQDSKNDPAAQSRIENLKELEAVGRSMESAAPTPWEVLRAFLDRVALTAGSDEPSDQQGSGGDKGFVSLMTLHLAKGLEFPTVFLTGLEEGLVPHSRSMDEADGIEEERRLCYVGITRAMKKLYLTRAISRGMFSAGGAGGFSNGSRDVSRFMFDIPNECFSPDEDPFTVGPVASGLNKEEAPEDDDFEDSFRGRYSGGKANRGRSDGLVYRGPQTGRLRSSPIIQTADALGKKSDSKTKKLAPPPGSSLAKPRDLAPGLQVLHAVFGKGKVDRVSGESEQDLEVFVNFENFEGTKKLLLKYAKLWIV